MAEVRSLTGHAIHPDEQLMAAGIDSRGGMELRRSLAEALGMQLPVTLLYDYQSINAIVDYVNTTISEAAAKAAGTAGGDGDAPVGVSASDAEGGVRGDSGSGPPSRGNRGAANGTAPAADRPSELMKTLRPPATLRPLFLAAPGVANAQSAYFSFSQFLSWSSQPIYVLDKDNDLNVSQLAVQVTKGAGVGMEGRARGRRVSMAPTSASANWQRRQAWLGLGGLGSRGWGMGEGWSGGVQSPGAWTQGA